MEICKFSAQSIFVLIIILFTQKGYYLVRKFHKFM